MIQSLNTTRRSPTLTQAHESSPAHQSSRQEYIATIWLNSFTTASLDQPPTTHSLLHTFPLLRLHQANLELHFKSASSSSHTDCRLTFNSAHESEPLLPHHRTTPPSIIGLGNRLHSTYHLFVHKRSSDQRSANSTSARDSHAIHYAQATESTSTTLLRRERFETYRQGIQDSATATTTELHRSFHLG